jgi:hypothetical protein
VSRPQGTAQDRRSTEGVANKRTREIADRATEEGITPLEVQLRTMRELWKAATEGETFDRGLAVQACAIAKDAAPYLHPRLSSVEAQISGGHGLLEQIATAAMAVRAKMQERLPEAAGNIVDLHPDPRGSPAARIGLPVIPWPEPRRDATAGRWC